MPLAADQYFRTSKTCELSVNADEFIQDLDRRIADYMGFEPERTEGIEGQYYQVGNEFKTHTDCFEPNTKEYDTYADSRGELKTLYKPPANRRIPAFTR